MTVFLSHSCHQSTAVSTAELAAVSFILILIAFLVSLVSIYYDLIVVVWMWYYISKWSERNVSKKYTSLVFIKKCKKTCKNE